MIKNLTKKLLLGAVAVTCAFTLTACGPGKENSNDNGNNGVTETLAQQQVTRAKSTYNSFYNKNGGLFAAPSNGKSAAKSAVADTEEDGTAANPFDTVRETLNKYPLVKRDTKAIFNSYVADIFSYSQVQMSIIDSFGEEALKDVYALNYENVNWGSDTTGLGSWIQNTKLLSAAFAGTDLENGNVYCTQAHALSSLVLANLEYYYNSDGDMGVTTINWHSSGRFEYHYCSAGSYEILQAYGNYNDRGDIFLTSFNSVHQGGERSSSSFSADDKKVVYDYVQSEISRINGKIESLQQQNEREQDLDGTEEQEGEHIGVCSVKFDFSILSGMLLK